MIRASLLRFMSFFRTAQHGPDFERFTMNQSATHREAAAKLRLNDVQRKELLASHGAIYTSAEQSPLRCTSLRATCTVRSKRPMRGWALRPGSPNLNF